MEEDYVKRQVTFKGSCDCLDGGEKHIECEFRNQPPAEPKR